MSIQPLIEIQHLCSGYERKTILEDVSFTVNQSEQWAVIGENGAGKSTLVKCIAGIIPFTSGNILLNSRKIYDYSTRERAHWIAYIPQAQGRMIPFTVYDYIMQGRYAHQGFFASVHSIDKKLVEQIMQLTDTYQISERIVHTLSGGEAQRVFLASAVAQQARIMLLDEPTTHLDPAHTAGFYKIVDRVHTESGCSLIAVTHDINAALHYYSHILALKQGKVLFSGQIDAFIRQCPGILKDVYDINFREIYDSQNNTNVYISMS